MLWWTILVTVVLALVFAFVSLYVVYRFCAPEDRKERKFAFVIAVWGVTLSCLHILVFTLDVANVKETLHLHLEGVWGAVLVSSTVTVVVLIPLSLFHYDALDSDEEKSTVGVAVARTAALVCVVTAIFFAFWWLIGGSDSGGHSSPLAFLLSFAVVVGWMVFSWMGGIGFFAIPFCGVYSFLHRTIPISEPEYEALCSRMHDTSGRLLEVGKQLEGQSSKGRKHKNRVIEFKRQVRNLEERFAAAETAFHTSDSVVLLNYVWLVVSMIGGCISVVWIVHLFVHNVFQLHPFLDGALVNLSGVVPMAGTLTFFLLSLHLLLATLAGFWVVTQFTTPFPVLHMQKGATTLNSILYNIEVLLIGSFAALYLCAISFSEYAANTCLLTQIVQKMNTVTYMHNIMTYLQYGQPALALAFPLIAFAIWKLGSCCTAERDEADE